MGCPAQSGKANASTVSEKISIRPLGVPNGWAAGSARKSASHVKPVLVGSSSRPVRQNSANDGTGKSSSADHLSYMCSSHSRALRPSVNCLPNPSQWANAENVW
ncbi:Uncharacterised protein [Mycobacterium tuberculosis]|nr:Uncharacterised protein [Mycobacterium tuberculosis]